jgi:hypothetical protein
MRSALADRGRRGRPSDRSSGQSRIQESPRTRGERDRHVAGVDRGRPRSRRQDAHRIRSCDEPGSGIGAELHEQVADVVGHGLPAHPESLRDLPARHPESDEPKHPQFGRGDPPNRSQEVDRSGVGMERRLMSDHGGPFFLDVPPYVRLRVSDYAWIRDMPREATPCSWQSPSGGRSAGDPCRRRVAFSWPQRRRDR